MGRKRGDSTQEGLFGLFVSLPWWVGPPVAFGFFLGVSLFGNLLAISASPFLQLIGGFAIKLSWLLGMLVFLVWCAALEAKSFRHHLFSTTKELESLRALGWREFESLVGEALRRQGYNVSEQGGTGPEGGIDLIARRADETVLVQCKHWKTSNVGIRVVREMYGVMTAEQATRMLIVTTGRYTKGAQRFAERKPIQLMDGPALVAFLSAVKSANKEAGKRPADRKPSPEQTPRCPKCGSEMLVRVAKRGLNTGQEFLGCIQYPRCRGTRDLPGR
jgi:restriction system protein